jgi:hypothetical protein
MHQDSLRPLHEAIARNAGAVISLPVPAGLSHHRTRLLRADDDPQAGFWIESVSGQGTLIDRLVGSQDPVGFSFKAGQAKVIFTTPLARRLGGFAVNPELSVEALLLPWPAHLRSIQRRNNYRVRVPIESPLVLRVWTLADRTHFRDRPRPTQLLQARARDISTGGIGLLLPPQTSQLAQEQRLRVSLQYEEVEVLLEGRVRYASATPDQSLRVGVQFKGLQRDVEGRQNLSKLNHIVGQLHRIEVRNMRLALPA